MSSWRELVVENILVCPADHGQLAVLEESWVQCQTCSLKFPVVDDIPVLLLTDAIAPE